MKISLEGHTDKYSKLRIKKLLRLDKLHNKVLNWKTCLPILTTTITIVIKIVLAIMIIIAISSEKK